MPILETQEERSLKMSQACVNHNQGLSRLKGFGCEGYSGDNFSYGNRERIGARESI